MPGRHVMIALTAALGAATLAACETDTYGEASAPSEPLKYACRPGDTEAGTRSGLACSTGSSTASPSGSDANLNGAASAGFAPAIPDIR